MRACHRRRGRAALVVVRPHLLPRHAQPLPRARPLWPARALLGACRHAKRAQHDQGTPPHNTRTKPSSSAVPHRGCSTRQWDDGILPATAWPDWHRSCWPGATHAAPRHALAPPSTCSPARAPRSRHPHISLPEPQPLTGVTSHMPPAARRAHLQRAQQLGDDRARVAARVHAQPPAPLRHQPLRGHVAADRGIHHACARARGASSKPWRRSVREQRAPRGRAHKHCSNASWRCFVSASLPPAGAAASGSRCSRWPGHARCLWHA